MLDQFAVAGPTPAPEQGRLARWRRVLGVSTVLIALLFAVTVAGYVALLNHTVASNVRHEPLLPTPGVDGVEEQPVKKAGTEKAQNLLVIGRDGRARPSGTRSDVIVLVHIAADRRSVSLVHFPRDLYVDVPGRGKAEINAAYASGGAPLLVRTIQGLTGVPVDHVAVIGFDGLERMTDALGGVDVQVAKAGTSRGHTFAKGLQHMDGDAALAYVSDHQEQGSRGDTSLGQRQQAFIKGLILTSLRRETLANPLRVADVVEAGTSDLTVDEGFSVSEMRAQAFDLRGLRGDDIRFVTVPHSGIRGADGGWIDLVEPAGMADLTAALQDDAMHTYGDRSR